MRMPRVRALPNGNATRLRRGAQTGCRDARQSGMPDPTGTLLAFPALALAAGSGHEHSQA
ncbi:hypothetical protein THIX_60385 [Thiomonas sp. X19]|nr:hypothetical protein THIX_60385 [Thiomonas sp. X19]